MDVAQAWARAMASSCVLPTRTIDRSGCWLPGRLTQAIIPLQRLQEAYPELKSNANFLALQDQLEGTENRINASRRDYNEAVRSYNTRIRTFPDAIGAKIFYGAKPKVGFQAAAGSDKAPDVNFNAS